MATLLTDEIKRSFAELALALGDPMAQRFALAHGIDTLLQEHVPCVSWQRPNACVYYNLAQSTQFFSTCVCYAYNKDHDLNADEPALKLAIASAFDDLARHILTPSYALIAADTIRHYEGPDSGEYGFYWDLTAEQKILSDVVRGILVHLDGAIKRYLDAPRESDSSERIDNGDETVDIKELYLRIGSLGDCVRDGILHTYSSYEFWQSVARDILKNNAPEAYKQVLEDERSAPAAENKSGSKKK